MLKAWIAMVTTTDFFSGQAKQRFQLKRKPSPKRNVTMKDKQRIICDGSTLLKASRELRQLEQQLKTYLTMPSRYDYASFCQPILLIFAEFVQTLPASDNQYFSNSGGILLHAFDRACIATDMYRQQLAIADEQTLTPGQALWMYVVFTSALMHRVGHFIYKLETTLSGSEADQSQIWQAMLGPMTQTDCTHYQYQFKKQNDDYVARAMTRVLAHLLLPKSALAWITRNDNVYKVWLALLEEDWAYAGSMAGIIPLANIESVANYFKNLAYQRMELRPEPQVLEQNKRFDERFMQTNTTFADKTNNQQLTMQEAGIAFLQWLQQTLKGSDVNNIARSPALLAQDGSLLLMFPQTGELVKQFLDKNPQYGNLHNVIEQFSQLGITQADANNNHLRKIRVGDNALPRSALIVSNPQTLFVGGTPVEARVPYVPLATDVAIEAGTEAAIDAIDAQEGMVSEQTGPGFLNG